MALIIDGYNLLYSSTIIPSSKGAGNLETARDALLNFLAKVIDAKERPRTVVVFDAANAPPGLPREMTFHEMHIRFAAGYDCADTLIEELVEAHNTPRQLTVVSSDHRIQRAAKRRRSTAIDSDVWCSQMVSQNRNANPTAESKPQESLTPEEIADWIDIFDDEE